MTPTETDFVNAVQAMCGEKWLARVDAAEQLLLMSSLIRRFNHDLRTPLNTIVGWTHLLQNGALEAARANHVAEVIARNTHDQTQMLQDFVDDARTILGSIELQASRVVLDEQIATARDRLNPMLTLHEVSLKLTLNAGAVEICGDPTRLTRLLYRLAAVLVRRTPHQGAVRLTTSIENGHCLVSISAPSSDLARDHLDWTEAALLDLRIATLVATLHGGGLDACARDPDAQIRLRLPLA